MKKYMVLFLVMLMLLIAGCQNHKKSNDSVNIPQKEDIVREKTEDFLGAEDDALVKNKGQGQVVTHIQNGKEVVSQRKYDEKLFGLDAGVEYFYGDSGSVSEIVAVFDGTEREKVVAKMIAVLGEPKEKQEETEETQFRYFWEKDQTTYTLLDPPHAAPAVIMQKKEA